MLTFVIVMQRDACPLATEAYIDVLADIDEERAPAHS
jgi:hypothetical protein